MELEERLNQTKEYLRTLNKDKYRIKTYATKEDIEEILNEKEDIQAYKAIIHDKDKDEDGKRKVSHAHIIIILKNRKKASTILNWFKIKDKNGKEINTYIQPCDNLQGAINYLTHKGEKNKNKYQYEEKEIFGNGEIKTEEEQKQEENEKLCNIIIDINNSMDEITLIKKYGKEYTHFEKNYRNIAIRQQSFNIKEQIYSECLAKIKAELYDGNYNEAIKILNQIEKWNEILNTKEYNAKAIAEQIKMALDNPP